MNNKIYIIPVKYVSRENLAAFICSDLGSPNANPLDVNAFASNISLIMDAQSGRALHQNIFAPIRPLPDTLDALGLASETKYLVTTDPSVINEHGAVASDSKELHQENMFFAMPNSWLGHPANQFFMNTQNYIQTLNGKVPAHTYSLNDRESGFSVYGLTLRLTSDNPAFEYLLNKWDGKAFICGSSLPTCDGEVMVVPPTGFPSNVIAVEVPQYGVWHASAKEGEALSHFEGLVSSYHSKLKELIDHYLAKVNGFNFGAHFHGAAGYNPFQQQMQQPQQPQPQMPHQFYQQKCQQTYPQPQPQPANGHQVTVPSVNGWMTQHSTHPNMQQQPMMQAQRVSEASCDIDVKEAYVRHYDAKGPLNLIEYGDDEEVILKLHNVSVPPGYELTGSQNDGYEVIRQVKTVSITEKMEHLDIHPTKSGLRDAGLDIVFEYSSKTGKCTGVINTELADVDIKQSEISPWLHAESNTVIVVR